MSTERQPEDFPMSDRIKIATHERCGEWFWVITPEAEDGREVESSRAFDSEDAARADAQVIVAALIEPTDRAESHE